MIEVVTYIFGRGGAILFCFGLIEVPFAPPLQISIFIKNLKKLVESQVLSLYTRYIVIFSTTYQKMSFGGGLGAEKLSKMCPTGGGWNSLGNPFSPRVRAKLSECIKNVRAYVREMCASPPPYTHHPPCSHHPPMPPSPPSPISPPSPPRGGS